MESNLFNSMGMGGIDPGVLFIILLVLFIIVLVMLITLLVKYNRLQEAYTNFMQGKKAKSLEQQIENLFNDIEFLRNSTEKNRKDIIRLIDNLRDTYQRVGVVKYDAFKEMGGKLSFSVALLNDRRNGFILNSVHSSEGCYVYVKEINRGESAISLGEEEEKALLQALQNDIEDYE
ncbi:MAG: DUF4446 family protein [Clostridia bacterium]|nr:DUF4446 family protein [Clostridia bacterium]